jgi:pyruvate kinase
VYDRVREVAADLGRGVGVLADLQGPKIRVGRFEEGPVRLGFGDVFTITTEDVPGDREQVSTTYKGLPGDVHPGDTILVDDGRLVLEATRVLPDRVVTRVVVGGMISDNKGLNLPGVNVSAPALTDKDEADLRWALRIGVDMIALSFVRRPSDADVVRNIMEQEGVRLPLLAKIEKPQAVDRLPEIIEAFDGIMVARGDLGVELPLEQVPIVQRRIITLCREKARPVIVATQMLDSMMSAPRPTRAEASDVAYAVMDGADAVMLSGETSVGNYPIESVSTMDRIARAAEEHSLHATHSL